MNTDFAQGQIFGRLTIIEPEIKEKGKRQRFLCQCSCGNQKIILGRHLKSGHTISCGCFRKETTGNRVFKHGDSNTSTYNAWARMKNRCTNKNSQDYKYYGERGISVCERWNDYSLFVEDMGHRPDGLELDRIDNNKNYCKENCRWANRTQQMRNQKRSVMVEYNGESLNMSDLADRLGINRYTFKSRICYLGWSVEDAISKPIQMRVSNG